MVVSFFLTEGYYGQKLAQDICNDEDKNYSTLAQCLVNVVLDSQGFNV